MGGKELMLGKGRESEGCRWRQRKGKVVGRGGSRGRGKGSEEKMEGTREKGGRGKTNDC